MKIFRASLAILSISSCSAAVVNLTTENYAELTDGKTVFIKFFAPWCGHCKAMASDWEQLGADWDNHEIGMVAEIDCTAEESQDLCDTVEGFPTLRYGDASDLEDYNGGRTYEELAAFAKDTLSSKVCSVKNIDVCSDEKKAQIEKYMAMDFESLVAAIEVEEEKVIRSCCTSYLFLGFLDTLSNHFIYFAFKGKRFRGEGRAGYQKITGDV